MINQEQKEKDKIKECFKGEILSHIDLLSSAVSTNKGDWIVKGFIDIAKTIYTISVDTKVVSKIMELLLFPKLCKFADENGYKMVLCKEQNFYPDIDLPPKNCTSCDWSTGMIKP